MTVHAVGPVARVLGLGLLAGGVAATAATLYRWRVGATLPPGLALLFGVGTVAAYLNTTAAFATALGGQPGVFETGTVLVNAGALGLAAAAAGGGRVLGDRLGTAVARVGGGDRDVSQVVRAVGRVVTVDLPATVGDVEGYDPVPDETKAALAGRTLVFPRRLTVAALEDRLVARLKDDYGVGRVDVDVAPDGTVEYLALGARAAGIGPTLAPGTVAVAVRADPPRAASPGDVVEVWRPDDPPERVVAGELRAAVDDVVTLVVDAAEADRLDDGAGYRLVTLPGESRVDREFVPLLRAAEETMDVATVTADGDLVGVPVGALAVTVVAVRPGDGPVETLPSRERVLSAGDVVYALAAPGALRRLQAAAAGDVAPDGPPGPR